MPTPTILEEIPICCIEDTHSRSRYMRSITDIIEGTDTINRALHRLNRVKERLPIEAGVDIKVSPLK